MRSSTALAPRSATCHAMPRHIHTYRMPLLGRKMKSWTRPTLRTRRLFCHAYTKAGERNQKNTKEKEKSWIFSSSLQIYYNAGLRKIPK